MYMGSVCHNEWMNIWWHMIYAIIFLKINNCLCVKRQTWLLNMEWQWAIHHCWCKIWWKGKLYGKFMQNIFFLHDISVIISTQNDIGNIQWWYVFTELLYFKGFNMFIYSSFISGCFNMLVSRKLCSGKYSKSTNELLNLRAFNL